jgi:uncharacterized protein with NRDE domain
VCILILALGVSERWPLLLVANRDEAHARPSADLAEWADQPEILAGRDLVSGGTWLGVSRRGRVCAVTNRRGLGPPEPASPSRGGLVVDVLRGADPLAADLRSFSPVSLVAADLRGGLFRTNRPVPQDVVLGAGLHGLSNGPLDEPSAKLTELKRFVAGWASDGHEGLEPLFEALRSESSASEESPETGVFMRHPNYGTRCSTVVAVDGSGRGFIVERRFGPGGTVEGDTTLSFGWSN